MTDPDAPDCSQEMRAELKRLRGWQTRMNDALRAWLSAKPVPK